MPTVNRRTFLFGSASFLASPAIANAEKFIGHVAFGNLEPALKYRRIVDLCYSCMPTGEEIRHVLEEPVRYTLLRDEDPVLVMTMNMRASGRWVASIGGEIEFPEHTTMRLIVEPCHTWMTLTIGSNIEKNPVKLPVIFYEMFRWRNGAFEIDHTAATQYAHERELLKRLG
jgi:hypothetical protein